MVTFGIGINALLFDLTGVFYFDDRTLSTHVLQLLLDLGCQIYP